VNPLVETLILRGLLFDALGVVGLGLLGIAAARLSLKHRSWGGTMMALGAVALLVARLYFILAPHFLNDDVLLAITPVGISLTIALPPLLLSFGLAGIVWGLWGHERWVREETGGNRG
jgi:hypothetical protein